MDNYAEILRTLDRRRNGGDPQVIRPQYVLPVALNRRRELLKVRVAGLLWRKISHDHLRLCVSFYSLPKKRRLTVLPELNAQIFETKGDPDKWCTRETSSVFGKYSDFAGILFVTFL
jgi:hypothetical protein